MSRVDTAMSRWLVYAQTHGLLPLDMRVFPPILERLRTYLQACVGPSMNKDSSNSGNTVAQFEKSEKKNFLKSLFTKKKSAPKNSI